MQLLCTSFWEEYRRHKYQSRYIGDTFQACHEHSDIFLASVPIIQNKKGKRLGQLGAAHSKKINCYSKKVNCCQYQVQCDLFLRLSRLSIGWVQLTLKERTRRPGYTLKKHTVSSSVTYFLRLSRSSGCMQLTLNYPIERTATRRTHHIPHIHSTALTLLTCSISHMHSLSVKEVGHREHDLLMAISIDVCYVWSAQHMRVHIHVLRLVRVDVLHL